MILPDMIHVSRCRLRHAAAGFFAAVSGCHDTADIYAAFFMIFHTLMPLAMSLPYALSSFRYAAT